MIMRAIQKILAVGDVVMIEAVLFDLDGTLIDTNGLIIETFKHVLKKERNILLSQEEIVQYFGEPLLKTMERFDKDNAQSLYDAFIRYNEMLHDQVVQAMDGAAVTISELKQRGIRVGVVSSKRRLMVDRGLKVCGLSGLMDVIITPEDTEKHKPDAEPMLKACRMLGVNPSETIMVGDSHFDILCGKNAGALTCLVEYTAIPLDIVLKYKPDYTICKLLELLNIIDGENANKVETCKSVS